MWPTLRTLWYSNVEPLPRLGVSKCQKSWNDLPSPSGPTLANSSHWPQWTTHFSALGSTAWGYKKPFFLAPKKISLEFLDSRDSTAQIGHSMLKPALWRSVKGEKKTPEWHRWRFPVAHGQRATTVIQNDHFGMLKRSTANARKTLFSWKISRKKQYIAPSARTPCFS